MAQHDYVIDNSTGANVRADINSALLAISSNNSGSSAPSTTYALQSFADTTNDMLKLRNEANNGFVNLRKFDGSLPLPDGSESSPSLFFDDDTNTGIYSSAADTLNITTGGSTAVTVNSSQNVGIGTASQTGKLSIASGTFQSTTPTSTGDDIVISGNQSLGMQFLTLASGSSNNNIYFGDTDDPDIGMIRYAHSNNSMQFRTNTSLAMTIDSSSRIGIGTSNPASNLHIASSLATIRLEDSDVAGGASYSLITSSSNGNIEFKADPDNVRSGSDIRFHIDGSTVMFLDSSGNCGIGTTSPNSRLNLNIGGDQNWLQIDKSRAAGEAMLQLIHSAGNRPAAIRYANADDAWKVGIDGSESFTFANGATSTGDGTVRMTLDSSGNIGAPSGTNIFNASDSRVKTNVVDLDKGLTAIKSLRPVSFNWIDGFCDKEKNTLYGFIAQEVNSVDSNLIQDFATELTINENKIENVLRVNEKFIIPMLVKAIQELSAKVDALEAA